MRPPGPDGHTSTEPQAVDWASNPTSSEELEPWLRAVRADLMSRGRRISMSGMRRLYTRWLDCFDAEVSFGRFLGYADPTGETATNRAHAAQIARSIA